MGDLNQRAMRITVLVRKLRQRLQAVGAADWIESIYGMGYRLTSPEK
jgi:DNA-binding response OmpR family regulator